MEFLSQLFLNFVIGVISGVIAGWFVSLQFKRRRDVEKQERLIREDRQKMFDFLESVKLEIDLLIGALTDGKETDISYLKRVLAAEPKTNSFSSVEERFREKLISIRKLINDIKKSTTRGLMVGDLKDFETKVIQAQLELLKMKIAPDQKS